MSAWRIKIPERRKFRGVTLPSGTLYLPRRLLIEKEPPEPGAY